MKSRKKDQIRNVVLLGHGGCGKTTLVESLACTAHVVERLGKIEDGNTISDYDKEEIKRHFSIHTAIVPLEWRDTKINFLDTPGYFDFAGETIEALYGADAAVIVISAKTGVLVGTERAFLYCEQRNLPCLFFVTDMDDEKADFEKVIESLTNLYGKKVIPLQLPIRKAEKLIGYVDVLEGKGWEYSGKDNKHAYEIQKEEGQFQDCREKLLEFVAETDEELMDKYFGGEEFTEEELHKAVRVGFQNLEIFPVLMGASIKEFENTLLLDTIVQFFPMPGVNGVYGLNQKSNEAYEAHCVETDPFSAQVIKTIADPFIGKFSLIKVQSGCLKADDVIYNVNKGEEEKLSRLYVLRGKEQIETKELWAGDIGAIGKLSHTVTGDSLTTKDFPIRYEDMVFPEPYTYVRYEASKKGEDDKIASALGKLLEEDVTLKAVQDADNHQSLLYGLGEQHLEVVLSKLKNRYKIELELSKPRIPYRETIRKKVSVRGKYKKQSGGHGQYGDVLMDFEPLDSIETPYVFEEKIFGGAVPKNYFPAVEKGIVESVKKGPLAGYPVVGIHATLMDGSYHPVDSSELAFKMAAIQAFKQGFMEASPVLLEPIVRLEVKVPERFTGDVMGELNKRRARVLGMEPSERSYQVITSLLPLAEVYGYSTVLRSMTAGYGEFSYQLEKYEQAPSMIQDKIIKEV